MEKIFTLIKLPNEKRENIKTFCLIGEAGILWSTMNVGS